MELHLFHTTLTDAILLPVQASRPGSSTASEAQPFPAPCEAKLFITGPHFRMTRKKNRIYMMEKFCLNSLCLLSQRVWWRWNAIGINLLGQRIDGIGLSSTLNHYLSSQERWSVSQLPCTWRFISQQSPECGYSAYSVPGKRLLWLNFSSLSDQDKQGVLDSPFDLCKADKGATAPLVSFKPPGSIAVRVKSAVHGLWKL